MSSLAQEWDVVKCEAQQQSRAAATAAAEQSRRHFEVAGVARRALSSFRC